MPACIDESFWLKCAVSFPKKYTQKGETTTYTNAAKGNGGEINTVPVEIPSNRRLWRFSVAIRADRRSKGTIASTQQHIDLFRARCANPIRKIRDAISVEICNYYAVTTHSAIADWRVKTAARQRYHPLRNYGGRTGA